MGLRKLTNEQLKIILLRLRQGETCTDIAKDYGVTPQAVAHHGRKHGLLRPRAPVVGERVLDEVIGRWDRGETIASLARELGIANQTLSEAFRRRLGYPPGRPRRGSTLQIPKDPTALAYLAGIFDGEGCITRNSKVATHTWQVVITNTSPELESWLKKIGGSFYYPKRQKSTRIEGQWRKKRFEWKVMRAWDVVRLLESLRPYLLIKASRADEAVADIRLRFGEPLDPSADG